MDLGDFDPFSSQFLEDPYAHFKKLRDESPAHFVASRDMWILSRHEDIEAATRNHAVFSSTGGVGYDWNQRPMMPMYDPPQHTKMRRMVAKPFTPASLNGFRPRIDALVDELVRRALDATTVDVVADLALPLSLGTIAELLGVPPEHRASLRRWSQGTIADLAGGLAGSDARRVDELRREFNVFLRSLIEQRRHELASGRPSGSDVISMLVAAQEDDRMSSQELVAFCVLLMVAGFETTVNAVANGLLALMTHPEEFRKLRAAPELVPSMIEEVVRWDGPVLTFFRNTLSDVTLHGSTIPKGAKVMLAFASGNRDERKFAEPDHFRIDRDSSDHLGYGAGIHYCLGAPLARLQLAAMSSALLRHTSSIEQNGEAERTASVLFRGVKSLPVHLKRAANAVPIPRSSHADWLDTPERTEAFEPKPMRIAVGDDVLDDLRARLERVRWPDEIEHAGWDYGTNLEYLKTLIAYWREHYDWRARERELNELPHFTAAVDDLTVHFIHARTTAKKRTPLLLLHGWPGPFTELLRLIPRLTRDDSAEGFDVVIGSLPGFPFSSAPSARGMGTMGMADVFAKLMAGLGYDRYGVVGFDYGAGIASRMGLVYPERLVGIHLSSPHEDPPADQMKSLTEEERTWLKTSQRRRENDRPYDAIHSHHPQTLAYGLNDSPVALAAWLVERYRAWSDCDGEVEARFSKDDLLTSMMLYWCTGTAGSAIRIAFESRQMKWALGSGERIETPTAIAICKKDWVNPPRRWIERVYNLRRLTHVPAGGHFGGWEEPDAIAADVRTFFAELEGSKT